MERFDVAVIGGGLLGCFAARNLCRWDASVLLLEAREDVCTGISRANSAIIYPGYDHKPGTLKASMTVRGNEAFGRLCEELDVPFSRCGSLMLSYGPKADPVLRSKYDRGLQSAVPGLSLVSGREAEAMEPCLTPGVSSALYAPTAGTVNPWELCIAACENALQNGAQLSLNTSVLSIRPEQDGYRLITTQGDFFSRAIINCAGMQADQVQRLIFPCDVTIHPTSGDYLILDRDAGLHPSHIIQAEPEDGGKGLNAVPTVEGSLLLGPSERENGIDWSVSETGLSFVRRFAGQVYSGRRCQTERFEILIETGNTQTVGKRHKYRVAGIHKSLGKSLCAVSARFPALLIMVCNLNTTYAGKLCIKAYYIFLKSCRYYYGFENGARLIGIAYCSVSPLCEFCIKRFL